MNKLGLRCDPIRLVLSRGPWAVGWYLLVTWALLRDDAAAGDAIHEPLFYLWRERGR